MYNVALFVYHVKAQLLLVGRDNGEALLATAKHGAVDRLRLTCESPGGIHHIVDIVAFHTYVLKGVDMSGGIYVHVVIAFENGQYALA